MNPPVLGWDQAALAAVAAAVALVLLASALSPAPQPPAAGSCRYAVDVNSAPADELRLLPGIGPVLARRIVRHRSTHGAFESLGDLRRVPGLSPACVESLRGCARALPRGPGKDPRP